MVETWELVEERCKSMPALSAMFNGSALDFWKKACGTITEENTIMLGGMNITNIDDGIHIDFYDGNNNSLCEYAYSLLEIVDRGLEGKENLLLFSKDAPYDSPFRYVLSMEPMPDRTTRGENDLLSHFHFQFGSSKEKLILDGRLVKPMWYATMCEGKSTIKQKCNIVRGLHKMPGI